MNTAALREQIQKAQQHEKDTGLLTRQLESKLPHLHPAIQLPEADAQGVLTRFVAAYIDEVPDLLDAANEVAREAGIESQIKPVLKIAEQYFLQPPAIMAGHRRPGQPARRGLSGTPFCRRGQRPVHQAFRPAIDPLGHDGRQPDCSPIDR